jgi:hypothetical protein
VETGGGPYQRPCKSGGEIQALMGAILAGTRSIYPSYFQPALSLLFIPIAKIHSPGAPSAAEHRGTGSGDCQDPVYCAEVNLKT